MPISKQPGGAISLQFLIPPSEVSAALGVTVNTLQVWRSTGRQNLPYVKVGGRVMYRQSDVEAYIERHLRNHTGDAA